MLADVCGDFAGHAPVGAEAEFGRDGGQAGEDGGCQIDACGVLAELFEFFHRVIAMALLPEHVDQSSQRSDFVRVRADDVPEFFQGLVLLAGQFLNLGEEHVVHAGGFLERLQGLLGLAFGEQFVALEFIERAFDHANLLVPRTAGGLDLLLDLLVIFLLGPCTGVGLRAGDFLFVAESAQSLFENGLLRAGIVEATEPVISPADVTQAFDLLGVQFGGGQVLRLRVGDQGLPELVVAVSLQEPGPSVLVLSCEEYLLCFGWWGSSSRFRESATASVMRPVLSRLRTIHSLLWA